MSRRGFTLIEAMVVCGMLGLVIGGAFLLFAMGSRGFHQAVSRTGAVGDIHTVMRALERDVRLTHFYSIATHGREVSGQNRDGLTVAGLSDWSDSARFREDGLPRWDRWVTFYATTGLRGRMIRLETERSGSGGYYPIRALGSISGFMSNDPVNLDDALRVTKLCDNVEEFRVETDPYSRIVKLHLRLFNQTGRRMTSEEVVEEFLETELEISPLNSYPEL